MSYYTSSIFEIGIQGYNFSFGGGGRYDNLIGTYLSQNISACGFSIGFERLYKAMYDLDLFALPKRQKNKIKKKHFDYLAKICGLSEKPRNDLYKKIISGFDTYKELITTSYLNIESQKHLQEFINSRLKLFAL